MRYRSKPMSRKGIEEIAEELRRVLGIENTAYVDVIYVLENVLPVFDAEFSLDIVPDEELDAHARAYPEDHTIKIRESVYEGARNENGRDRFTIVHEIFHFLWHGRKRISLARNPDEIKTYEDPEWQADAFAGYFLMPTHLIRGLDAPQIMELCGVSRSAAKCQMNIISKKDRSKPIFL